MIDERWIASSHRRAHRVVIRELLCGQRRAGLAGRKAAA
jgi:hypothetical protein